MDKTFVLPKPLNHTIRDGRLAVPSLCAIARLMRKVFKAPMSREKKQGSPGSHGLEQCRVRLTSLLSARRPVTGVAVQDTEMVRGRETGGIRVRAEQVLSKAVVRGKTVDEEIINPPRSGHLCPVAGANSLLSLCRLTSNLAFEIFGRLKTPTRVNAGVPHRICSVEVPSSLTRKSPVA